LKIFLLCNDDVSLEGLQEEQEECKSDVSFITLFLEFCGRF